MSIEEAIEHCKEISETCDSKECSADHHQLAKWLEELKDIRKLFTLTPEEVKIARKLINKGMYKLGHEIKQNRIKPSGNSWINNFDKKEPLFRDGKNLLNRIKQWQDEIHKKESTNCRT